MKNHILTGKKNRILRGFGWFVGRFEAHLTFSPKMKNLKNDLPNMVGDPPIGMSLWHFSNCQTKECAGEGVNNAQGTHFRSRAWKGEQFPDRNGSPERWFTAGERIIIPQKHPLNEGYDLIGVSFLLKWYKLDSLHINIFVVNSHSL